MTLTTLIINELKYDIDCDPTIEELKHLSEHLKTHTDEKSTMGDFETEIWNWVKANTVKCSWCGKRHMPTEMYIHADSGEYFCEEQCVKDYQEEHGVAL